MKIVSPSKYWIILIILIGSFIMLSFNKIQNYKDWLVPAKYQNMKNPTKPSNENLLIGKSIYTEHCEICHGRTGKGDGSVAYITGDKYSTAQTDGALYYKTIFGRGDMPNFESVIPKEEDRWYVVNYLRTLKYIK